jgi:hypothetical protein
MLRRLKQTGIPTKAAKKIVKIDILGKVREFRSAVHVCRRV